MKTGMLKKDKFEQIEFFIEYPPSVPEQLTESKYVDFTLEPDKLKVKDVSKYTSEFFSYQITRFCFGKRKGSTHKIEANIEDEKLLFNWYGKSDCILT